MTTVHVPVHRDLQAERRAAAAALLAERLAGAFGHA